MLLFQKNQSLKDYSTWGIGGPAKLFCKVSNANEMQEAMQLGERFIVIGKGSNCLFDDRGFNGLVILNKIEFCERVGSEYHVGSGYNFSLLGSRAARAGLAGLEFASGIPGTVGGAVFMNAGAGGHETCDALVDVQYMHKSGDLQIFKRADLNFSYRSSPFQTMEGAIISARFQLTESKAAKQNQLDLIRYRTATQPYGEKTCGCVFRNPGPESAGAIIEKCGLKGLRIGGVEVSDCHANFLINRGDGTSKDVLELVDKIKQIVQEKEGVKLQFEVCKIGY